MTPSAQLAEIRERIAQLSDESQRYVLNIAEERRKEFKHLGRLNRLALALVSAEMAVEVKS